MDYRRLYEEWVKKHHGTKHLIHDAEDHVLAGNHTDEAGEFVSPYTITGYDLKRKILAGLNAAKHQSKPVVVL